MAATHVDIIRDGFIEALRRCEVDGQDSICVSFWVDGLENVWAQANLSTINFAYPETIEPLEFLARAGIDVPPEVHLDEWKGAAYATFWYDGIASHAVFVFVERFLVAVHALDSERYTITTSFEVL